MFQIIIQDVCILSDINKVELFPNIIKIIFNYIEFLSDTSDVLPLDLFFDLPWTNEAEYFKIISDKEYRMSLESEIKYKVLFNGLPSVNDEVKKITIKWFENPFPFFENIFNVKKESALQLIPYFKNFIKKAESIEDYEMDNWLNSHLTIIKQLPKEEAIKIFALSAIFQDGWVTDFLETWDNAYDLLRNLKNDKDLKVRKGALLLLENLS